MTTTTEREWPRCAGCGLEIKSFEEWFTKDCPARIHLPPKEGGHQLSKKEWISLPFQDTKVV